MFEVLVYLYENYFRPDACPDADTLARKLSAAGFEGEEINDALSWLSGLAQLAQANPPRPATAHDAFRVFAEIEYERLGVESIGFLSFLESAGVISATLREIVIERALATDETPVPLSKLKIIVLMVLWSQGEEPDTLILDELLEDGESPQLH
jgi:Smg protein